MHVRQYRQQPKQTSSGPQHMLGPAWLLAERICMSRSSTSEDRLHEALDLGDATSVVVHLKHFARTLHSVAMMAPAQVSVCKQSWCMQIPAWLLYCAAESLGCCLHLPFLGRQSNLLCAGVGRHF